MAGVGLFILVGPKAIHKELAENFVSTLPKIQRFTEKYKRPFIAKIYRPTRRLYQGTHKIRSGRVELWVNYEQWSSGFM